jgi:hypothetical protein
MYYYTHGRGGCEEKNSLVRQERQIKKDIVKMGNLAKRKEQCRDTLLKTLLLLRHLF